MILFTLRTSLIQLPLSPEHLSPTTPVTVCSTYVGLLSASELSFISFSQSIKCASPLCLKCFPSGTQISILKEFLTLESKLILLLNTQSFPFSSSLVLSTCMCALLLQSCLTLWTLWTVAHQAPLRFSRREYWSGLPTLPRGSSRPRDRTCAPYVCCIDRWVLYH